MGKAPAGIKENRPGAPPVQVARRIPAAVDPEVPRKEAAGRPRPSSAPFPDETVPVLFCAGDASPVKGA